MTKFNEIQLMSNEVFMFSFWLQNIPKEYKTAFLFPIGNEKYADAWGINFPDEDWEHALLNLDSFRRCPTYPEMCRLKEMFWKQDDVVLQVHPRKSEYINVCKYCLHLWRDKKISERTERVLRRRIETKLEQAKDFFVEGKKQEILLEGESKVLAIFGGGKWPGWEQVCKIKQKYWRPEEAAVQFNISQQYDLNDEYIILLWDAEDFALPSRELV